MTGLSTGNQAGCIGTRILPSPTCHLPCLGRFLRLAAAGSFALIAACGGGGDSGGGVPVTMTLTATVVSASRVDLTWTPATRTPFRYDIYLNRTFLGFVSSTSQSLTGLAASTRYCFVIFAVDFPFGAWEQSNEVCVTTPADLPPTTPGDFTATVVSPARVDLAWTAAKDDWGIARYRIDRDSTELASVTGLGHVDASLNPATTYCYAVTAIDTGGNASPTSAPVCVTTPVDSDPPTAPTGLFAAADGVNITLRWNPSTDNGAVASYLIYRDGSLVQTMPAPTGAGVVQATDSVLTQFDQYCYQVVARDRAGNNSPPSNRACTTTSWELSVLVPGALLSTSAGVRNALAVDANGVLHVGYSLQSWQPATKDFGPPQLRYANNAAGAWSDLQIAPGVSEFHRMSVATDANARPHFAFIGSPNGFAMYAQPSGAWQAELVSQTSTQGISLALDATGSPRITFGGTTLRYASRTAGTWSIFDVPGTPSDRPAFALDAGESAHIAFLDTTSRSLRYASDAGGAWATATIEAPNTASWHSTALAIDAAGAVHVTYFDGTTVDLKYATNRTGAWVTSTIDSDGNVGFGSSIAVDSAGAIHVSYIDGTKSRLKYATNASGAWLTFELDFGGSDTSIAIDRGGRIHILYHWGHSLRYATRP